MRQVKPAQLVRISPIVSFSLIIFFITLADGIMSYMAPIIVEDRLKDTFLVGIVISISSFFGILLDFIIAGRLPRKSFKYFITKAMLFAVLFPISLLIFPSKFIYFAVAMIIWSIYYEFIGYSKYNFIEKHVHIKEHTNAWSTLLTFSSLAYMIGPGIAVYLIEKYTNLPLYTAIVLVGISVLLYLLLEKTSIKKKLNNPLTEGQGISILREFGLFKVLMKRLWLLILFYSTITLMDVLIWTIGILYSDELGKISYMGYWLIVIYGIPSIFTGLLTNNLKLLDGKKRTTYTASAIAGLCLIFSGIGTNIPVILMFVFIMATLFEVSVIMINSTFQDYMVRTRAIGNDIVSLLQFAHNLSYSLGPIFLGLLAKYIGFSKTFQIVGLLVIIVSFISFFLIPRKIRMPQKEIEAEAN